MIGQYLSNTNENATVPILQNFLQLNKALVHPKIKNFLKFHTTLNLATYT